jgi:hypothetical protein
MAQQVQVLGRVAIVVGGAVLGAVLGYMSGAYLGCAVLWRASNLCGLPGVFFGLPIGALAGSLAAHRIAQRLIARPTEPTKHP